LLVVVFRHVHLLRRVASVLVVALVLVGAAPSSRESELGALRGEIARLERELDTARASSRTLAERVRATALDLSLQEGKVREARLALELSSERGAAGERAVEELEVRLDRLRDSLRVTQALYVWGASACGCCSR
jgi:septal ring factor EnvC (AmiA/AmiB activator)